MQAQVRQRAAPNAVAPAPPPGQPDARIFQFAVETIGIGILVAFPAIYFLVNWFFGLHNSSLFYFQFMYGVQLTFGVVFIGLSYKYEVLAPCIPAFVSLPLELIWHISYGEHGIWFPMHYFLGLLLVFVSYFLFLKFLMGLATDALRNVIPQALTTEMIIWSYYFTLGSVTLVFLVWSIDEIKKRDRGYYV